MAILSSHNVARLIGYAAPATPAAINLLSVATDGPLSLVLTFDRPPAGTVLSAASYTITPAAGATALSIASVALGPVPTGETYPFSVCLTFAAQGTGGELYGIAVAGITGPCDEPLGIATGSWTAEAVAPQVVSAVLTDDTHVAVTFDRAVVSAGTAGSWGFGLSEGGGTISVSDAVLTSPTLVTLALASAVTRDAEYTVTADPALEDAAGNPVDPAHDTADCSLSALRIDRAWWEADRVLCIRFAVAVKQTDAYDATDALCVANYTATLNDGGEAPVAIDVETIDALTVRVYWTGPLGTRRQGGVVTVASTIVDLVGYTLLAPYTITLAGVLQPSAARKGDEVVGFGDIREDTFGSGSALTETGDLAIGTSVETLRKLALREMTTLLGTWVYQPSLGQPLRLKRLLRDSEIDTFIRNVRDRLSKLPDVVGVQVSVSQAASGIFSAAAKIQSKTLGTVNAYWPGSSLGGVQ